MLFVHVYINFQACYSMTYCFSSCHISMPTGHLNPQSPPLQTLLSLHREIEKHVYAITSNMQMQLYIIIGTMIVEQIQKTSSDLE